jgi:fatty-acyl-CoA synthase
MPSAVVSSERDQTLAEPPVPNVGWLLGARGLAAGLEATKPAVRWSTHTRTFGDLRTRALALAHALRSEGLGRGDYVATLLFNRGEILELYFACAFAGVTLVPLNFRLVDTELATVLADCPPSWLFCETELHDVALNAMAGRGDEPPMTVLGTESAGAAYEALAQGPCLVAPDFSSDIHLVLFSSGTTGRPKGACLGHAAIVSYVLQQAAVYPQLDSEAALLVTGPMFNAGGINDLTIASLAVGASVNLLPSRGWSAAKMIEHIARWQVTHAVMFPSMMEPMLQADRESPADLASMKFFVAGGENCPPELVDRFRRRWPHITVAVAYGSTEVGLVTMTSAHDASDAIAGMVGRPVIGSSVRVVTEEGSDVEPGQVGEVWAAAGSAFSGYLADPELSAETIHDGWVAMGDMGRLTPDGSLRIVGRKKDVIISAGQNIYPAEVESALQEHPAVIDAAVVSIPDPRWGESVCAFVVLGGGEITTAETLLAFLSTRLASYKKPRFFVFSRSLPRNASNKVLKAELREQVRSAGESTQATGLIEWRRQEIAGSGAYVLSPLPIP